MVDDEFGKEEYTEKGKVKFNWARWKTTENFPLPTNPIDWVIGQEQALEECKLAVKEWVQKAKFLKEQNWAKDFEITEKPKHRWLPFLGKTLEFPSTPQAKTLSPGPYILLLGDPGTGKSLLGKAMQNYMTEEYVKNKIMLYDVLCWKNEKIPSNPKISLHPAGEGEKIVAEFYKKEQKKTRLSRWFFKGIVGLTLSFGLVLLAFIVAFGTSQYLGGPGHGSFIGYLLNFLVSNIQLCYIAVGSIASGGMLYFFQRMMGSVGGSGKGTGGSQQTDAPKLIVDNRAEQAPLVEATGHRGSQLFGSIAWDPYQNASLGTPEHQRVTAGDVHRANLGIIFIDEIKNLAPEEAVTLLTVLQEGKLPVTMRGILGGSDTAAMAVSTEPIPAMVFLVAAGNMDSITQIHPALMDRIYGYGKVVKMNNDMPNTVENRRKYVQFIAQEIKNFNLPPFTREACLEVIAEARRKSGKNDFLTCRFRQMVAVIKTAGNLALNENAKLVEKRHVEEALKRCRTVFEQVLAAEIKNSVAYKMINPDAEPQVGQIYGLAVKQLSEDDAEGIGAVLTIRASMVPAHKKGGFTVTGVNKKDDSWVQNSIAKVRHVFTQLYGKDPMDFLTHIDFVQENLIEGPSAGVAMTLALISAYTKKKIRQDVAVTGEINIGGNGEIDVTAVGGVPEKILAAQSMNFKKVCIPARNYEKNIVPSDYTIQIIPCKTLRDYIKEVFVEGEQ